MPKSIQRKLLLIALLGAVSLVARQSEPGARGAFFVLGVLNVLAEAPGTGFVRAFGFAAAIVSTLTGPFGIGFGFWTFLLWLPAFISAWAVGLRREQSAATRSANASQGPSTAQIAVVTGIVACAIASIAYRLLVVHSLQQTAALFVGVPTVIAITMVVGVSPRSAIGVACKAVTVGLLMSMILLQEGFLCVAMAAPLFYAIAIGVAATMNAINAAKRPPEDKWVRRFMNGAVIVVTIPMSLEGVTPATTIDRSETVSVTRVVHASATEVEQALMHQPRFERTRPRYLRAGFPTIAGTRIESDGPETRWVMEVRGGEMLLNGMEHRTGQLTLSLAERRPGLIRWRLVSDTSHTTHFLWWRESIVEWERVSDDSTKVTWTLRYERGLDPAWYFGPMERYAVRLSAGYLIDAVATP
jgi:hypothetical protein